MTQTRRSFLKSSLAASTALALPFPAFAQDGVLNVALIVPSPAADCGQVSLLEEACRLGRGTAARRRRRRRRAGSFQHAP